MIVNENEITGNCLEDGCAGLKVQGAYGELVAQYDGSLTYWNIRRWADTVLAGGENIGRAYSNGDRFYYLKDHASTTLSTGLGSVRVTVNNSSTVQGWNACPEHSRRDYYPFGLQNLSRLAGMDGRSGNVAHSHSDQKFPGMLSGAEAYHAGARLYDPEVPRFYGSGCDMRVNSIAKTSLLYSFNKHFENPISSTKFSITQNYQNKSHAY